MPNDLTSDLNSTQVSVSKDCYIALLKFLQARGRGTDDVDQFVEDAIRWRIFDLTLAESRKAFADIPQAELQRMIDEAVEETREQMYQERLKQRECA